MSRKEAYDKVYVRWNTKEQTIAHRIRVLIESHGVASNEVQCYVETFNKALVQQSGKSGTICSGEGAEFLTTQGGEFLSAIDTCVTNAYDKYRRSGFTDASQGLTELKGCRFTEMDNKLIECTNAVTDSLLGIIGTTGSIDELIKTDRQNIMQKCRRLPPIR
jgi:hypothetical protein